MMAAASCYNVELVCFAVTEGGLSEYTYGNHREAAGEAEASVDEAAGMPKPKLCLCLWRSHYWSTRPLSSPSLVSAQTALEDFFRLPSRSPVPSAIHSSL